MKQKPYWEMTTKELAEATKQFDEPFVVDKSRPLTVAEREQWRRARRKRGRPKVGQGFKRVSVSLEKGLLKRATALAKKRRLSRSKLFAQMLESALVESQYTRQTKAQESQKLFRIDGVLIVANGG